MGGRQSPVQHALAVVKSEPRGHLPRPERVVLLRSLGPYVSGGQTPMTDGHRARARLAVACVREVLPAWAELLPNDDWPEKALAAAEALLRGEIERPAAVRVRHGVMGHADDVDSEFDGQDFRVLVCRAAHGALCVALSDEWLGGEEGFPVDAEDDQLDPLDLETAYLASVVAANGFLDQPTADVKRRRRFWVRYLTEHLPAAVAAGAADPGRGGGRKGKGRRGG